MRRIKEILFVLLVIAILQSCSQADGNFTGSEYIPDMGHSIAYESNVYTYYERNTWDDESTFKLKELSGPRLPVKGTIPRGYAGHFYAGSSAEADQMMEHLQGQTSINEIATPINGNVPYYYEDTEEERTRAIAELLDNPFPITEKGLADGKELYTYYCAICHGDKGDGNGYLASEENPNALYPAAPANFTLDDFVASSNGRYYHAIMYGKNMMGAHSDKLSYEERWQVIHYIRSLQAKSKGVVYNNERNSFNPAFGTPAGKTVAEGKTDMEPSPEATKEEHSSEH